MDAECDCVPLFWAFLASRPIAAWPKNSVAATCPAASGWIYLIVLFTIVIRVYGYDSTA